MTVRCITALTLEQWRAAGARVDVLIDFGGGRYLVTTHESLRSNDLSLDATSIAV